MGFAAPQNFRENKLSINLRNIDLWNSWEGCYIIFLNTKYENEDFITTVTVVLPRNQAWSWAKGRDTNGKYPKCQRHCNLASFLHKLSTLRCGDFKFRQFVDVIYYKQFLSNALNPWFHLCSYKPLQTTVNIFMVWVHCLKAQVICDLCKVTQIQTYEYR
jgi:hypothetical protein